MTSAIETRKEGGILEVTLNRPKANAVDLATSREMGKVFQEFRDDPDMRVAILTGAGEKFFCPGWDLKAASNSDGTEGDAVDGDYGVGGFGGLQELPQMNKPVICAVNGICCGGGLEIALSCDMILAAEHASFASKTHPISHCHGTLADGSLARRRRSTPLGLREPYPQSRRTHGQSLGNSAPIRKWPTSRLCSNQRSRSRCRRQQIPRRIEPHYATPAKNSRHTLWFRRHDGRL